MLSCSLKVASSTFAGLLVSLAGKASAPGSALAGPTCQQPAVVLASDEVMPVTKANYADAETQTVFAKYIAKVAAEICTGGLGTIWNDGETADPTDRTVIRINFDTLYSWLIVDLTTPATFTLPQTNGRYQTAMVVNGQGDVYVEQKPGEYTLTQDEVGTRFALVAFRTGVNIQDPEDVAQAQALQAKLTVNQADTGEFVQPNQWDLEQMLALRAAYTEKRNEKGVKSESLFGRPGEITPEHNNMDVAVGIGG